MRFAKIDGNVIHGYRFDCQLPQCVYCFEYGLFYANRMQSMLDNRPEIYYDKGNFFLEVAESDEKKLLRKFYPKIKGLSLSENPPLNDHVPILRFNVQKDELIESFMDHIHLPKYEIIRRLGLRNDTYYIFSKIALEYFGKNAIEDTIPKAPYELEFIKDLRYVPNLLIDQAPISLFHLKNKIDYVNSETGINNKHIFCIGDNDLVSLAISELYNPKEITAVDIDSSVIEKINKISKARNYPINTLNMDFRSFPHIEKDFDVFLTDPPFTNQGMYTFIRFGINQLKIGGTGHIAIPKTIFEKWTVKLFDEVISFIQKSGCYIISYVPDMHLYERNQGISSGLLSVRKESNRDIPKCTINNEFYTRLSRKLCDYNDCRI